MQDNPGLTESANWDYVNEGETAIRAEFRRLILILLIMKHILMMDLFIRTQRRKLNCQKYIYVYNILHLQQI